MSGLLGKIPKFTLKLPSALGKAGRTMSECPLELSFSLCEDNSYSKSKTGEQYPLQVMLPAENCEKQGSKMENKETFEKAEEEKSEKEENMEVTCSVSVDGQEKQEFSFTLYDFDTRDKVNKQDVEKVVVRSICEALGKTLKLPPSGSRTIKVRLAISPDSSKDSDTKEQETDGQWTADCPEAASPSKTADYCSAQSANTASTYVMSSNAEKLPANYVRYFNPGLLHSPIPTRIPSPDTKQAASPKSRPGRHGRSTSLQRQDVRNCLKEHDRKVANENIPDNRHQQNDTQDASEELRHHQKHQHQHQSSRDHVPECRDRRNHYLDLAGVENNVKYVTESPNSFVPSYVDPTYICPYRILDRTHVCSKSHRTKEGSDSPIKKPSILCHPKVSAGGAETAHVYRTRIHTDPKDDLLNLNFDLCDLVPDVKFDWEKLHHRRSKSYDLYENEFHHPIGLCSPKLKQRPGQGASAVAENQKIPVHLPSSPGHHYRHRHREREKQRAMQQVASWIEREHSSNKDDGTPHVIGAGTSRSPHAIMERHEHHHLHEHIHHHYHHFVEF